MLLSLSSTFQILSTTLLPAMNNNWPCGLLLMLFNFLVEGQKRSGTLWHSVLLPGGELELSHSQSVSRAVHELYVIQIKIIDKLHSV